MAAPPPNPVEPAIKLEKVEDPHPMTDAWDTERQLVSALHTLQQMDSNIHQLRNLVPERLLGPLKPIISQPQGAPTARKSPQELFQQLSQAVRDGNMEIDNVKASWNSHEMNAIFNRVDKRLKERGGECPHMNDIWDCDYKALLQSIDKKEKLEGKMKSKQEKLETDNLGSVDIGWENIIEMFKSRGVAGITLDLLSSGDHPRLSIDLHNISTTFYVQQAQDIEAEDAKIWHVSLGIHQNQSKLALEMLDCIQARDMKGSLMYLLEMISSYADIKRSPCVVCKKLIATNAQLPTIRKPRSSVPSDNAGILSWDSYHLQCA